MNNRREVVVFIDNENWRASIKNLRPDKNISYPKFIPFLKNEFARDAKLKVYLVVSLLGTNLTGLQKFLRAMKLLEMQYGMDKEIDFELIEIPPKEEKVYSSTGEEKILRSQVDQKIINLFLKESLEHCGESSKLTFILVSGDSDFLETLSILRKKGIEIKIVTSRQSCSSVFRKSFEVVFIEDILSENLNSVLF